MFEIFSSPASIPGMEWRILVALLFSALAAYYDIFNKKWIPNILVYAFLASSIALNIIFFDQAVFISALAIGIFVFAFSYLLYKLGQLGGADMYFLAGIAMTIPYLSKPILAENQSIPYPFILSVLIPTGMFFIFHMLARFIPYISRQISNGNVQFTPSKLLSIFVLAAILFFFVSVLTSLPVAVPLSYFAIIFFLSAALLFFSLFKDEIKDSMIESVRVSKLQEEDVLALEKMDASLVKKLKLQPLIDGKIILALKKSKVKAVPVYTGMPFFLPYLFLGLLLAVLFGDLLFYMF
jgi:Flp pilus assembly protein protease CpaA